MSLKKITANYPTLKDFPAYNNRAFTLSVRRAALDDELYQFQKFSFDQEKSSPTNYIELLDRAPNITLGTGVLRAVVDDQAAMLFGDGRWPELESQNAETRQWLKQAIKESNLPMIMRRAVVRGSIGSVAIRLHLSKNGRIHFKVFDTVFLTPIFNADEPDQLDGVIERYLVKGEVLAADPYNYSIARDRPREDFFFQRIWDETGENWFIPYTREDMAKDGFKPVLDTERTVPHSLGFCPWVWLKNLNGDDDHPDGESTFQRGIETAIAIDFLWSQAARQLRYVADPTLLIKEPAAPSVMGVDGVIETPLESGGSAVVTGASQMLTIDADGDAEFLEISGDGAKIVIEVCGQLRDGLLEILHGDRVSRDKQVSHGGTDSLKALNNSLINRAEELRTVYGDHGLLNLLKMVLKLIKRGGVRINGKIVPKEIGATDDLSLTWGAWYAPTEKDRLAMVQTMVQAINGMILSRDKAVANIAAAFGIEDCEAELTAIAKDIAEADARAEALAAAAVQVTEQDKVTEAV
jgi:hypothetical protein